MRLCLQCGAGNLGTRFCETCGVPAAPRAAAVPDAAVPPPLGVQDLSAVQFVPAGVISPSDPARPFRVVSLVSYFGGVILMSSLEIASYTNGIPYQAVTGTDVSIAVVVGLFMMIAAAVGRAGAGGKAVSVLLAIAYPGAVALSDYVLAPTAPNAATSIAQAMIAPAVLFLCWGVGRPFRGAGYVGLLVVIVTSLLRSNVSTVLGNTTATYEVMLMLASGIGLAIVVQASLGFEGTRPGTVRTNPLARASLVLVMSTFLLNGVSGALGPFTIAGVVVVVLVLVLAIILGHAGFVDAGRKHERGRGLAATALVLGYLVFTATISLLIWVASLTALSSGL